MWDNFNKAFDEINYLSLKMIDGYNCIMLGANIDYLLCL